jgi:hypothetical protein
MEYELTIDGAQHPAGWFETLDHMDELNQIAHHHGGYGDRPWAYRFASLEAARNAAREYHEMGFRKVHIKPVEDTKG